MKKILGMLFVAFMAMSVFVSAKVGMADDAIWSDGHAYDVIATPALANMNAPAHTFDALYVFGNIDGQRGISDAAPGQKGYNGGRWIVRVVTLTEDGLNALDADNNGVIDSEITSDEDLHNLESMGYAIIGEASQAIVCPLH